MCLYTVLDPTLVVFLSVSVQNSRVKQPMTRGTVKKQALRCMSRCRKYTSAYVYIYRYSVDISHRHDFAVTHDMTQPFQNIWGPRFHFEPSRVRKRHGIKLSTHKTQNSLCSIATKAFGTSFLFKTEREPPWQRPCHQKHTVPQAHFVRDRIESNILLTPTLLGPRSKPAGVNSCQNPLV